MYNLQWLKIEIKIFSNRKIQILLKEQDGDTYFRVWIQLLTIAIECNCNGKLVIGDNKPMTIEDFFKIMGKSKKKIEKIIKRFQELNMIIVEEGAYKIKNWDEYQSIESSEKYKEQNRIRQQKYRERLKSEKEKSNVTITENNAQEDNTLEEIIENNRKENENIENTKCNNYQKNFHNKCKFCGKELKPIGLDYLYTNISPDSIEYERCTCKESVEFWKGIDLEVQEQKKNEHYREIINQFYSQNYISKRLKDYNFNNFKVTDSNKNEVEIAKDYTKKCTENKQENGLIITGNTGVGKTHLAASISNELIKEDKIVLMGRLSSLLDMIKETFKDNSKSENELIELFSNTDMVVIDDLGTEKISQWALDKLYTIIENRNENKLPIIITTRFNKESLLHRFYQSNDKELSNAIIQKLYRMCYGIELKEDDKNQKEKASISD